MAVEDSSPPQSTVEDASPPQQFDEIIPFRKAKMKKECFMCGNAGSVWTRLQLELRVILKIKILHAGNMIFGHFVAHLPH